MEHARTVKPGQQVMGGGAAVLIEHGIGHVVQVVGCHVAEDQALEDGRKKEAEPAARVLEDRQ